MSPEVEAAAMAQQASRMFTPGGSSGGLRGGGAGFGSSAYNQTKQPSPATSSFAEVADDADFDLVPNLDLVDMRLRDIDDAVHEHHGSGDEDDFEMGDGTGAGDYGVAGTAAGDSTAVEEPEARSVFVCFLMPLRQVAPGELERGRCRGRRSRHRFLKSRIRFRPAETRCSTRPWPNRKKRQNVPRWVGAARAARRSPD